jgi:phosphomannomutase
MHSCHPVKAYDIRGPVSNVTSALAHTVGEAFAQLMPAETIIIGHDMRLTSPALATAFAAGATSRGKDVMNIGLVSTDELYFASGTLHLPAAMITASHNPASDNGIKLVRPGASPVARDTGLEDIHAYLHTRKLPNQIISPSTTSPSGQVRTTSLHAAYIRYLRGLVDLQGIRPLKVAIDAGNGMAGRVLPDLLHQLPLSIIPLYYELDGTFPHHDANPMDPSTLTDLRSAVLKHKADLGIAFDGDADRCFILDEDGRSVTPCALLALLATRLLNRRPGATIVHDVLTSTGTIEAITEAGGKPVRSKVGHAFIKLDMERNNALIGGEASGHYYFSEFWHADSGPLAALHVLAALGQDNRPISVLTAPYNRYVTSGEVNRPVQQPAAALEEVAAHYVDRGTIDRLDGLTVSFADRRWFNLRPSNIEPVVRLTVEATSNEAMVGLRDEVLALLPSVTSEGE